MYEADKLNYSVLLWEAVSDLLENTEDLRGGRSQYYCSIWKLTFIYVDHFFNIYSVLYEADKLNYSVLLEADSDLLETIESTGGCEGRPVLLQCAVFCIYTVYRYIVCTCHQSDTMPTYKKGNITMYILIYSIYTAYCLQTHNLGCCFVAIQRRTVFRLWIWTKLIRIENKLIRIWNNLIRIQNNLIRIRDCLIGIQNNLIRIQAQQYAYSC